MLNCRSITRLSSQELERELSLIERAAVAAHLLVCAGCTNFRAQIRVLRAASHRYAAGDAPQTGEDGARVYDA